jgi:uncharacterized protein with HEPN domain/predicted nucleotidyltransferase
MKPTSRVRKAPTAKVAHKRVRPRSLAPIIRVLRQELPRLTKKYKIRSLGVFGSFVRGEQKRRSDLDVLIEYPNTPSLSEMLALEQHLSSLLGTKIDLLQLKTLKPYLGRHIAREVIWLQKDGIPQSVKLTRPIKRDDGDGGNMEPQREYLDFIQDMVECMENAPRHVAGMSYEEMLADRKTLLAVRSEVLMLGEAASRLPREIRERHPEIPWTDMIGTRHRVVHGYDRIDYRIVWKILHESIPRDLPLVLAMLDAEKKRRSIQE